MQAQADGPPAQSKEVKSHIEATLADALERSVVYDFYANVDPGYPVPSSDPYDEMDDDDNDDDETLAARSKRKRLSGVPHDERASGDDASPMCG